MRPRCREASSSWFARPVRSGCWSASDGCAAPEAELVEARLWAWPPCSGAPTGVGGDRLISWLAGREAGRWRGQLAPHLARLERSRANKDFRARGLPDEPQRDKGGRLDYLPIGAFVQIDRALARLTCPPPFESTSAPETPLGGYKLVASARAHPRNWLLTQRRTCP